MSIAEADASRNAVTLAMTSYEGGRRMPENGVMTAHDLAILAEHLASSAHVTRYGWPDVDSLDIAEYIDKAMDGAIVDDMDPPRYLVSEGEAAIQRLQICKVITNALVARYRRPLNAQDLGLIAMNVVSVWERNAEAASEAAFMRHAERSLNEDNDTRPYIVPILRRAARPR